jgi:hypothetical protein
MLTKSKMKDRNKKKSDFADICFCYLPWKGPDISKTSQI